jgi:hypothetical protein
VCFSHSLLFSRDSALIPIVYLFLVWGRDRGRQRGRRRRRRRGRGLVRCGHPRLVACGPCPRAIHAQCPRAAGRRPASRMFRIMFARKNETVRWAHGLTPVPYPPALYLPSKRPPLSMAASTHHQPSNPQGAGLGLAVGRAWAQGWGAGAGAGLGRGGCGRRSHSFRPCSPVPRCFRTLLWETLRSPRFHRNQTALLPPSSLPPKLHAVAFPSWHTRHLRSTLANQNQLK